jgi:hypothetical protein
MIYGGFAENTTKSVTFEVIDEGTFSRFCQFAYKGDYQPQPSDFEDDDAAKGILMHMPTSALAWTSRSCPLRQMKAQQNMQWRKLNHMTLGL